MDTARTPNRFVAIGDSTTEGIGDELPDGTPRGWADRFAAALAQRNPDLLYANFAIRGRRTAQILAGQAEAALALQPDLISAVVGVNDLVAPSLDVDGFDDDINTLFSMLRRDGAFVLTSTLPDLTALVPVPRRVLRELRARGDRINQILTTRAAEHGVSILPLAELPAGTDRHVWRPDRIHPNPIGHALLAEGMLQLLDGHPLDLHADTRDGYGTLPYARAGLPASAAWIARYLLPRSVRRLRGKSSGDGRSAKRPELVPVEAGGVRA